MDSLSGSTIGDWLPTIQTITGTTARHDWIVELGTNDSFGGLWPLHLEQEITALKHQRCVIFVTVNPRLGPDAIKFDAALATAVATHSRFYSLDWGNIEWDNPTWLLPDRIHPTPAGSVELAHLEQDAVATDCHLNRGTEPFG